MKIIRQLVAKFKLKQLIYLLLFTSILSFISISPFSLADDTFREWYPHTGIEINLTASRDAMAPGESITLKAEAKDIDGYSVHTQTEVHSGYWTEEDEIILPLWHSGAGSLSEKWSFSTTWTAPSEPGTYTISFTCTDRARTGPYDRGIRKDGPAFASIKIVVEEAKEEIIDDIEQQLEEIKEKLEEGEELTEEGEKNLEKILKELGEALKEGLIPESDIEKLKKLVDVLDKITPYVPGAKEYIEYYIKPAIGFIGDQYEKIKNKAKDWNKDLKEKVPEDDWIRFPAVED
jgi:hypothetical protein